MSFLRSMQHATDGIVEALATERNVQIDFVVGVCLFIFELTVRPALSVVVLTVLASALVIGMELLNTAIEHVTDLLVGDTYNEVARVIKDVAAGAVLVVAAGAFVVGVYMLWATYPWHWRLFSKIHMAGAWVSLFSLVALGILITLALRQRSTKAA